MKILTIKDNVGGVTCEECHGRIPDKYLTDNFGPTTDLELPDAKVTDEEFHGWLSFYRNTTPLSVINLLEGSRCN